MDYKACSTECSQRCGRERRPSQRTCRVCHAAQEKKRRATLAAELEQYRMAAWRGDVSSARGEVGTKSSIGSEGEL